MNAGGHGSDVAGCLLRYSWVDLLRDEGGTDEASRLRYAYRSSSVVASQVVVEAAFEVTRGDAEAERAEIAAIVRWRRSHQPGGSNAGSVFTNPPGDSAGRLIEEAGLKGFRLGYRARLGEARQLHSGRQGWAGGRCAGPDGARPLHGARAQWRGPDGRGPPLGLRGRGDWRNGSDGGERPVSPTTTRFRPTPSGPPPPREDMDPRISARRTEVTRQQGRRRLRLVGIVVAVALVGFLGWCLLHSSLFSARAITVVGATHETAAQIEAAAGLSTHPPLLDIQTGAEVKGIERLPWVRSASVSVHWPDGVRVVVSERVPTLVMAAAAGQWAELDADGRVLAVVATRPPGLIEVGGPQAPGAPGSVLGAPDQLGLRIAATLPGVLSGTGHGGERRLGRVRAAGDDHAHSDRYRRRDPAPRQIRGRERGVGRCNAP